MKTNLDKLFKGSESFETEGIWMDLSDKTGFLVRRFGGLNSPKVKAALAKHFKPYSRQIDAGTLDDKKEKEITAKVFIESCLVDWKGVEIDGKEVPYSQEAALKLLISLPDLFQSLQNHAIDASNYREDLGNS
jgi:hypothetical protein